MKRVRVLYDREIFVRQNFGGISRYFSSLFREFQRNPSWGIEPLLGFERSSNSHLKQVLQQFSIQMTPLRPSLPGLPGLMNGPEFTKDAFLTYRAGRNTHRKFDILHATYLRPRAEDERRAKYRVVTIQDTIAEDMDLPRKHPAHFGKKTMIAGADLVITTTALTAQRLQIEWPDKPIRVIPLGVDDQFFSTVVEHPSLVSFPYVLFTGGRTSYKNFSVLVDALKVVTKTCDIGLVCTGPPMTGVELESLSFLKQRNRFWHLQASDDQLPNLYRNASSFVFASTMEGFGLPVLEAAASGCPTILSDIPPFRELANSWAQFFDPTSSEDLALALHQVLDNPQRGVASPEARAGLPTWRTSANLHAQTYSEILTG